MIVYRIKLPLSDGSYGYMLDLGRRPIEFASSSSAKEFLNSIGITDDDITIYKITIEPYKRRS